MTFGELEIRDKFRSDAVPGVKFRKAPNGMGECVEDPNKSQFFWDTAVVGKVEDGKPVPATPVVPAVADPDAVNVDETKTDGGDESTKTGDESKTDAEATKADEAKGKKGK